MRLTSREEFALRVLLHLVKHYPNQSVSLEEIAIGEMVTERTQKKVMRQLCDAGFLREWQDGRYILETDPESLTMANVLSVMDDLLFPHPCTSHLKNHYNCCDECPEYTNCEILVLMKTVTRALSDILKTITLRSVCEPFQKSAEKKTEDETSKTILGKESPGLLDDKDIPSGHLDDIRKKLKKLGYL
jgi:Rrf2 family protein